MHTQTDASAPRDPTADASLSPAAIGLGLYLLTLTVEAVLGAGARWLLVYLGAGALGAIVPLGLGAAELAWGAALAPLAYSALALALPGQGWLWRLRLGARRPSCEEAEVLDAALELLRASDPSLPLQLPIYVLDDPLPSALVRGRAVILSTGLLEIASLPAVLAHELAHTRTLDGRLTEALARLVISADPLGPRRLPGEVEQRFAPEPDPRGQMLWSATRFLARLAGGGCAEQLLAPLWAPYWRRREYAADAHAASLGQGEDLATHLTDFEQPFDAPQRGLLLNPALHPPVAYRIERLLGAAPEGGP
jgi:Zn-dependent protease with chaperone function